MEVNVIRDALKVRILVMIEQLNHALENSKDNETPLKEQFTQSKYDMVKAHAEFISLEVFLKRINKFFLGDEIDEEREKSLKRTFLKMYRIACLKSLIANCGEIYAAGYLHATGIRNMKLAFEQLIFTMKPRLLRIITEASKVEIPSNIGNATGKITVIGNKTSNEPSTKH